MASLSNYIIATIALIVISSSAAFTAIPTRQVTRSTNLYMADGEVKAAPSVSGEELEVMFQDWDTPMVIDAYATWCGPCLLMSPEFEAAAKELEGKVRFVKLDTDQNEIMANKLAINGLPTLLFLDKFVPEGKDEEEIEAKGVLKGRIEGAIQKQNIVDFCDHYFFDGPEPKIG
mmetsp:Transcript_21728/g.53889  ORF Transcript_21728/g.53889 Transcript_21728/m.53889 type:complete len:174 (+) Transcript_21728:58-579(+)